MKKKSIFIAVTLLSFLISFYMFKKDENYKQSSYSNNNTTLNESDKDESVTGFPMEAAKWYYEQRAFPLGYIPANWREHALNHIEAYNKPKYLKKVAQALSWKELGPGNIGGRIRAIVVSPTDANTVYIGSVSGGIWKTTNGGSSWFPLDDHMANLAVCSMVIDPHNLNIIYAGTGEGFNNYDYIRGAGIFKSTDAGVTWNQLSSTNNSNFYYVNRLVIDNINNSLYAATRAGLYKSTDGGNTFTNPATSAGGNCMDVIVNYTNPTTIFATFGLFSQSYIWRSTDGGNTFNSNFNQSGTGRIEIAGSSSNPLVVYASFMNLSSYQISYMAYTTNGGNNWNSIAKIPGPATDGSSTYTGKQGWYNNTLAVDPTNASSVYAGGIDLFQSIDNGANWSRITTAYGSDLHPYIHADMHTIVFAPSNHSVIYNGNDGGIYVTTDGGISWNNKNNNLFITQFYYGAVSPTGTNYYGGTQDNYTLKSTGSQNWNPILGGDGGVVQVDYANPNIIYAEQPNFAFQKSTNGGSKFSYAQNGLPINSTTHEITDRTLFITPFTMDPNNPSILIAGTYRLWKTTNGASSWDSLSSDLTGDGAGSSGAYISAITIAKGNSTVIYAGCTNGKLWETTNGGSNWNERDNGLPTAWCTRIAIDNSNSAIAYATFSGFLAKAKIYKTTDYGNTWNNVSGDLPNIPVNCLILNPYANGYLYVGTDLGVFSSTNDGTNWIQENNGLANVSVGDLDFRSSDTTMYAATHGRGMFSTSLANSITSALGVNKPVPENFKIFQNYPNPFNPSTSIAYDLPHAGNVKLFIYNISGKEISTLIDNFQSAGKHSIVWDGKNKEGQDVSSGIYLYSVKFGDFQQVKKMIKLK